MTNEYRAVVRSIPISAQKIRLVINLVRGKDVVPSLDTLRFQTQGAAKPVYKLVYSAISNAEENFGADRNNLYIYKIFADEGRTRKWRRFGARGRFKPWLRRSAHITVILREREEK